MTCQEVIKRALRMLGLLAAGREPDAQDAADGLTALQGLYDHLVIGGTFGRLTDVLIDDDYTAGENERVVYTGSDTVTVTIPDTIDDDTATDGERPPRDRSFVIVAASTPDVRLYDANLAAWVQINSLGLLDDAPLAGRLSTGLCALLAAHFVAEFRDGQVPPTVALQAQQAMSALVSRWDSARTTTEAVYY